MSQDRSLCTVHSYLLLQPFDLGLPCILWSDHLTVITDLPPEVAKAWLQSWKWAAITVAVVTSPVIGKVAKVSFERFIGTIAGDLTDHEV